MKNKSFKIITLCSDNLVTEAFKSIILASGYRHISISDYSLLGEKIKLKKADLILIDENISVYGNIEFYYNLFKNYDADLPLLIAVSEKNKERINKEIITYINKPININSLKQLVEPYRENVENKLSEQIKLNEHTYNVNLRTLELTSGEIIRFTNFEAALILLFIKNSNKILSAKYLSEKVLGYSSESDSNTLKTHIWRLRKKLNKNNVNIDLINLNDGYVMKIK